jgi:CII-binding regulator of phage lambda lysogenization HflD
VNPHQQSLLIYCYSSQGQEAILTIYDDGQEKEQVHLYSLQTKEEMHAIFLEKGFQKKPEAVIQEQARIRMVEEQLESVDSLKPVFTNMFSIYGLFGCMVTVIGLLIRSRGTKQRRGKNLPMVTVRAQV